MRTSIAPAAAAASAALLGATPAPAPATAAQASEITTYGYDVHGRLATVGRSVAAGDAVVTDYAYDAADNRTAVTLNAGGTPPPPPPPPPPPGPNSPPVAHPDSAAAPPHQGIAIDVVSNDTDPDGHALSLAGVNDPAGRTSYHNATSIYWAGAAAGTYTVGYYVQDQLGAIDVGTVTVTVQ